MGKGGTVLGLIGIILGAGGLGFAYLIWNTQNTIQTQLTQLEQQEVPQLEPQEIWRRYNEDFFDVNVLNTYLTIPNMSLTIDLINQSSVLLLFTSIAYTIGTPGRSDIYIYFYVDEVIISNPSTRVGSNNGSNTVFYHSASLQYYIEGWSAGTHNISMFARSTVTTNKLQYCQLTVQSFPV